MLSKFVGFRGLAAVIGLSAIFASVGFADYFQINGGNKIYNAEGETIVDDCGNLYVDKDDIWVDDLVWNYGDHPLDGGWIVGKVHVSGFIDACKGGTFTVVLTNGDGEKIVDGVGVIGTNGYIDFSGYKVPVSQLKDLHILVDKPA